MILKERIHEYVHADKNIHNEQAVCGSTNPWQGRDEVTTVQRTKAKRGRGGLLGP